MNGEIRIEGIANGFVVFDGVMTGERKHQPNLVGVLKQVREIVVAAEKRTNKIKAKRSRTPGIAVL